MAILAVKIENQATLKMNEFFDYNGRCYALARSRTKNCAIGAELEDFYECTVLSDWIESVPVVFLCDKAGDKAGDGAGAGSDGPYICGWYKEAKIYRRVFHPSLFLEGNICARSTDAVLLSDSGQIPAASAFPAMSWTFRDKLYRVIEDDEEGYEALEKLLKGSHPQALPIRYELVSSAIDKGRIHRLPADYQRETKKKPSAKEAAQLQCDYCLGESENYAIRLMTDRCESIADIKTLREFSDMAATFVKDETDAHYYKALAEEHLGFIREGLKSVNRALKLEPDGADIIALKANLLADSGNYEAAIGLYDESYAISGDESYLLMKGRVLFLGGNVDGAYKVYREIKDKTLLEDAGINLKDMEHRWPFVAIRGLKNLLKKSPKENTMP